MPHVILLAGPNGAGKSTVAPRLLKGTLGVQEFVNADIIASGLSGFSPDSAAFQASRLMLRRLSELSKNRKSFAFESTLSAGLLHRGSNASSRRDTRFTSFSYFCL